MTALAPRPATLAAAEAAVAAGQASYLAGGTALRLGPGGLAGHACLIDTRPWLAAPSVAEQADGGLRLDAALTLETLRTHARVRAQAPLLAQACATLASLAVRHLATLGGNVGWRCGDTVPVLLVLGAQAELADGRLLPLEELLGLPALPLIRALRVPSLAPQFGHFEKIGWRAAFSPSRLALALHWNPGEDGHSPRLAAAGAGLPARRLRHAEAVLPAAAGTPSAALRDALDHDLGHAPGLARIAERVIRGVLAGRHEHGPPVSATANASAPEEEIGQWRKDVVAHGFSSVLPHDLLLARARPRPDAADKLAAPRYPSDRQPAGALHGAILGSPHPHARIVRIDVRAARAMPGVAAVVTAADIPGETRYGLRHVDRPVLCADKVRCIGDPVAAVAAAKPEQARAALAAIEVEYAPLPIVDDMRAALAADAEAVHAGGNLLHALRHARGRVGAAAAHVVEAEYHTPRQMHAYLETEGGSAEFAPDGTLVLHVGCQNPERDRQVLASVLALPPERLRVIGTPVGGSYGGKDELTIQPILALLALRAQKPVRLRLDREESTDLGVKRHAMRIRMRSGCDADGRLLFHEVDLLADTGAYATHGPEVLDAAVEHAVGPYAWQSVDLQGRLAYTNNGIAGAFRGFGAVQSQFALERQIDRLAQAAGIDPGEFRARNLASPDAPGPLGQVVAPFDGPRHCLRLARAHPLWLKQRRWRDGRWLHGIGLALVHRSDGFGKGGPNAGEILIALAPDGKTEIRAGFTEMGQNLVDAIPSLAERHLGCPRDGVRVVLGDTALTPGSGPTAASRATALIDQALRKAAHAWHAAVRAPRGGEPPSLRVSLEAEETPSDIPAAHFLFGACAGLAHARVDSWTGAIHVEDFAVIGALGPVASPQGLLGQMEGGALMGLGLATLEHLPMNAGRYQVRNLDGYFIPTLMDAPRFDINAVEDLVPGDPYGPRGAGEIGVNIAAPAIANAIAAACGMPVVRLPVRPDEVLDHLASFEALEEKP